MSKSDLKISYWQKNKSMPLGVITKIRKFVPTAYHKHNYISLLPYPKTYGLFPLKLISSDLIESSQKYDVITDNSLFWSLPV